MRPVLSIAIPTYNRSNFLEYSLERHLSGFNNFRFTYEVVISDNCSSDSTLQMIDEKTKTNSNIKYYRKSKTTDAVSNFRNAIWKSKGEFVLLLADDDALIPEIVTQYVEAMDKDKNLAGIYTDWIAYDDDKEVELHRYYRFPHSVRFEKCDKRQLINFVLENQIFPEVGIYRRDYMLNSLASTSLQYPFLNWMYNLSDYGSLVFSKTPFLKENRVVKPHLSRGDQWGNIEFALSHIGDEMRIALENLIQLLNIDTETNKIDMVKQNEYRVQIDNWLHSRVNLEINRAIQRKNWILAVELRRRLALWHGIGSDADRLNDLNAITIPATFQHIHDLYENDSQLTCISFIGFRNTNIHNTFKKMYPNTEVTSNEFDDNDFNDSTLYIYPHITTEDSTHHRLNVLDFSRYLDLYRISSRLGHFHM